MKDFDQAQPIPALAAAEFDRVYALPDEMQP
jgi:hypothetical protein